MTKIDRFFVEKLFNSRESGLAILRKRIDDTLLARICSVVANKLEVFEVKREKIIKNNQTVSLLYRGAFDDDAFAKSEFAGLFLEYLQIRNEVERHVPEGFSRGGSLEVKLIHYPVSDLGVDVHKDLSSNINLIFFSI